ncbi:lipase 1-like [Zophobas morio]|uniref:lipase 1-like n=1 Tax=Zophobas morio TaxID=2755281 RepID=UPI0030834B2D
MAVASHQTVLSICFLALLFRVLADKENAHLTTPQILTKYGYPNEVHHVTTSDGYILALHRILPTNNTTSSGKVVLVLHGLFVESSSFVCTGVEHGLGFILADEGYDVWLGNVRGTPYSRNHTTLNPNRDPKFWDFTFHEMGTIDLPTMVDHVLKVTYQKGLYYVGYSQGSTIFFVMMATQPKYNDKIKVHVSMAPAAYLGHMKNVPIRTIAHWNNFIFFWLKVLKINEIPPKFLVLIKSGVCFFSPRFCNLVFMAIFGYKPHQVNSDTLTSFLGHFPLPISRKQTQHFLQSVKSGYFRRYDYGKKKNEEVYGFLTPPAYDLSLVTVKCHLFYSRDDLAVSEVDAVRVCKELGNACGSNNLVNDTTVKHLDWLIGIRIKELVYSKLLNIMAGY